MTRAPLCSSRHSIRVGFFALVLTQLSCSALEDSFRSNRREQGSSDDLLQITPAPSTDPLNPTTCGNCLIAYHLRPSGDLQGSCVPREVATCMQEIDSKCRDLWDDDCVDSLRQHVECSQMCPVATEPPIDEPIIPTGLSIGWIFSIVTLSVLFAYFFFGICWNCRKGNSGVEVIPNSSFWGNLPGLVKDGCIASWYCVVGAPKDSYDYIDERDKARGNRY